MATAYFLDPNILVDATSLASDHLPRREVARAQAQPSRQNGLLQARRPCASSTVTRMKPCLPSL